MKSKRRHLSAEFKARIAKEALKGEKTIAEIATENEISPSQVNAWNFVKDNKGGEVEPLHFL